MQFMVGLSLAGVAYTIDAPNFVQATLACFWLMAFSSATHDIAADGFYMLGLSTHEQSLFVGIRSTFYRVATIGAQGGLLALADALQRVGGYSLQEAWRWTFLLTAVIFFVLFGWHALVLPKVEDVPADASATKRNVKLVAVRGVYDVPADASATKRNPSSLIWMMLKSFGTFFMKPQAFVAIAFMLLYRFPDALLVKIAPLFLLDPVEQGGLGLTTMDLALAQGTIGVVGLTLGGIVGGVAIAKLGFKRCLWWMVGAITLPHALYVGLACAQVSNLWFIATAVGIEQFGYGFGFTAYMMYMIYFSEGASKTTHYALCTAFMALSMLLPGMVAGWLQEQLGYLWFFILVLALTPLTCFAAALIKVDAHFGKKNNTEQA
jgi:PAT family beta-lactamase induction signal transducer AmpG